MRAVVLKAFAYHPDCRTVRQLAVDDVVELPADIAPGLAAEGYIAPASAAAEPMRAPLASDAPAVAPPASPKRARRTSAAKG